MYPWLLHELRQTSHPLPPCPAAAAAAAADGGLFAEASYLAAQGLAFGRESPLRGPSLQHGAGEAPPSAIGRLTDGALPGPPAEGGGGGGKSATGRLDFVLQESSIESQYIAVRAGGGGGGVLRLLALAPGSVNMLLRAQIVVDLSYL